MIKQPTITTPDAAAIMPLANHTPPPAELLNQMVANARRGVSFDPKHQQDPLLHILQSTSPACDTRSAAYIEGAQAGHFWLRNGITPIYDGVKGIEVLYCGGIDTNIEMARRPPGIRWPA